MVFIGQFFVAQVLTYLSFLTLQFKYLLINWSNLDKKYTVELVFESTFFLRSTGGLPNFPEKSRNFAKKAVSMVFSPLN